MVSIAFIFIEQFTNDSTSNNFKNTNLYFQTISFLASILLIILKLKINQ